MLRAYKKISGLFVVFTAIYLAQTFLTASDTASLAKYHISPLKLQLASLTVVLPYIAIWVIGLIGFLRLYSYAYTIRDSRDGEAFATLARGVFVFVLWLPVTAILGGFAKEYYVMHPSETANMVRLLNYLNLVILFPAFYTVYRGSQKLLPVVKLPITTPPLRIILVAITSSALYVLLVLQDPARNGPTASVNIGSYYEPDWLITVSLIIPRLLMWFLGVQAVSNIMLYRNKVKGSLYKHALNYLARGLGGVVILTITLRIFQSVSSQIGRLSLGAVLLVVYVLLGIISYGYILIAKGARNLQKLEEL